VAIAIITGSGTHSLPGFEGSEPVVVETPHGVTEVSRGHCAGVEALHLSRHGAGHVRLSNHVTHRANVWALKELGATAVVGCTACGAVDPTLGLGSLVVFDDLHFISNRLPDGSLCSFFTAAGDSGRGHWILHGGPFSEDIRAALVDGAAAAGQPASQTGGPETVLCGELELPYALIGFVTDFANEVKPGETTPVAELIALMGKSSSAFASVLAGALPTLASAPPAAAGTMYRFEQP
jgi:5'-methylthioadenosine phosphorylase